MSAWAHVPGASYNARCSAVAANQVPAAALTGTEKLSSTFRLNSSAMAPETAAEDSRRDYRAFQLTERRADPGRAARTPQSELEEPVAERPRAP